MSGVLVRPRFALGSPNYWRTRVELRARIRRTSCELALARFAVGSLLPPLGGDPRRTAELDLELDAAGLMYRSLHRRPDQLPVCGLVSWWSSTCVSVEHDAFRFGA